LAGAQIDIQTKKYIQSVMPANVNVASVVEDVYRSDWGRIVATLIGLLGDFDLAEEYAQEAFAAALEQWPGSGVPELPRAWIIQTARHKAIDRLRRRTLFAEKIQPQLARDYTGYTPAKEYEASEIQDERLRLIFTCCHPALAPEVQVPLTLRTLCGLETDEIARAFLVSPTTMAQRLVRAKHKIRDAGIPYVVPGTNEIAARLGAVLTVIYLVFNEGYLATRGGSLVRTDLCAEAIRLGRLLITLMAPQPPPEAKGLVALMLLHDARRDARLDEAGEIVILEEQDRSRWNQEQIAEALLLVKDSPGSTAGPFAIQAAIAAAHCKAAHPSDTDWAEIVRLYTQLERLQPSPIVSLNRAVAVAMADGPRAGLAILDTLVAANHLDDYHLLHAARADLMRRIGFFDEAAKSYARALMLVTNDSERRFLERRLREVQPPPN
jgi:RNA polymerase sigma-70 factor (ECF subfamily)